MTSLEVLIVEDNQWLAASYARGLTQAGLSVRVAANGLEAIAMIDKTLPDIILLDVMLTATTGFTLLHELQSHVDLARIPVVLVTNMVEHIALEDVQTYGVRQVIDKATVTPELLLAAVQRAL